MMVLPGIPKQEYMNAEILKQLGILTQTLEKLDLVLMEVTMMEYLRSKENLIIPLVSYKYNVLMEPITGIRKASTVD
jgi:hypothetical protein